MKAPFVLTAENPIDAYESAIPLLLEILPIKCSSSDLIRDVVWSIYRNHPVILNNVCNLDQDRKDALLALINLRMALGVRSDTFIHELLEESGEFRRRDATIARLEKAGLRFTSYPLTYGQACELAKAS